MHTAKVCEFALLFLGSTLPEGDDPAEVEGAGQRWPWPLPSEQISSLKIEEGNRGVVLQAVDTLVGLLVPNPKRILADKGYDGDDVRGSLLIKRILPVIPPRANRKDPAAGNFHAYRNRNRIERMFNKLKQSRHIATRYDKTVLSFSASSTLPRHASG